MTKRSPSAKDLSKPRFRKRVVPDKREELVEEALDEEAERALFEGICEGCGAGSGFPYSVVSCPECDPLD